MAQANLRVAAGIGFVVAFLLVGAPSAAVAIADPGGSHSGHSDKHDRSDSRGGSDWNDDDVTSGNRGSRGSRGSQKSIVEDSPRTRVGSGRESGTSDAGTSESGTSHERPGSDYSHPPNGAFKPPKVTFGDGRTPGVQDTDPEPRWRGGGAEPAPPPPPPPPATEVVDIAPPPGTNHAPRPAVIRQLIVAPAAELTDPMWGVAGLLLIPAAGAILGYRQARGAHAAAELGRHP